MISFSKDGKPIEPVLRSELIAEVRRLRDLITAIQVCSIGSDLKKKIDTIVELSNELERKKEPDIFDLTYDL